MWLLGLSSFGVLHGAYSRAYGLWVFIGLIRAFSASGFVGFSLKLLWGSRVQGSGLVGRPGKKTEQKI